MSQQLTREEQEQQYPQYTWDLTTILKVMKRSNKRLNQLKIKLEKSNDIKDILVIMHKHYMRLWPLKMN